MKILLSLAILLTGFGLFAQNTCSDQLKLAQRKYDSGLLEEIPGLLESCLKRGFTNEEKSNALKLLIQTYLFSDMPEKADEVMLTFLREFPEYTTLITDHKEFINLYRTYRTDPIMRIEVSGGINYSMPYVTEFYGIEDLNTVTPEYSSYIGGGVEVSYLDKLFGNFDGSVGLSASYLSIGYWNEPFSYTNIAATYKNFYVGMPISLRYNQQLFGLNFFVKGGVEPVYMLSSSIDFTRERTTEQDPISDTEGGILDYQNRIDIRPILSVGMNYKIGKTLLSVTTGFKFGTVKPTISDERYSFDELYSKYYFVPDDFFINQAFLNVSWVISVYKPKKIR